jgi:hypothetical protein
MSGIGRRNGWTLGIVSVALFMVVLDNLVVSVALPTIHRDLGASIQSLECCCSPAPRSAIASGASACS